MENEKYAINDNVTVMNFYVFGYMLVTTVYNNKFRFESTEV